LHRPSERRINLCAAVVQLEQICLAAIWAPHGLLDGNGVSRMLSTARPAYEWSKVLNFTERGNAQSYLAAGWGAPEATLTWTDGLNARLSFSARTPKSDVTLVMSCTPFLGERKVPFQELHVFTNFLRVGFSVLAQPTEIDIVIPTYVFDRPQIDIDFYIPRAFSPASVGLGADLRVLGVAVHRLMMAEV
jgi:hypothetical protein